VIIITSSSEGVSAIYQMLVLLRDPLQKPIVHPPAWLLQGRVVDILWVHGAHHRDRHYRLIIFFYRRYKIYRPFQRGRSIALSNMRLSGVGCRRWHSSRSWYRRDVDVHFGSICKNCRWWMSVGVSFHLQVSNRALQPRLCSSIFPRALPYLVVVVGRPGVWCSISAYVDIVY
jgi:hypothetical protein